jgi:hypothetical protein
MRITLLCTESLRTPACPGFGVSGDRKISCFDRFGRQREVGRELGLWGERLGAFERVQMPPVAGDRGGRGAYFGGVIERVQMGMGHAGPRGGARVGGSFESAQVRIGGANSGGSAWAAGSFERVQMGSESLLRPTYATEVGGGSVLRLSYAAEVGGAFKRAQMAWGLGRPTARRYSSGSSFERVQTRFNSAVWGVGDRTAGSFERVQIEDGLGMRGAETHASAGLFERVQMRVRFVMRRGAMPRLK